MQTSNYMDFFSIPTDTNFILLTLAFILTSSITTFDKRLTQAKRVRDLPLDEPSLPGWVSIIYWLHWGVMVAILLLNWKYAISLFIIGFLFSVLPVWEIIGNILMSPFKPKR